MKELGITKGEVESGFFDSNKHTYIRAQVKNEDSFLPTVIYEHRLTEDQCCHEECGCIKEELSNAKLIANTFNTANKCQMLPSELLQRYNEAIEVLEQLYNSCAPTNVELRNGEPRWGSCGVPSDESIYNAKQIISKAKP
jgi:hypothetical protein